MAASQQLKPTRFDWLQRELARWREEGLIDEAAAQAIGERYRPGSGTSVVRIFMYMGAALAGIGVIWFVAANLWDGASPLLRSLGVIALWLTLVLAAEALSRRETGGFLPGALRLLAAIAYGGAVFQVAQSLQVPAYEPSLLAAWGAGALLYAYAGRALAALVVGLGAGVGWYVWTLGEQAANGAAVVLGLAVAAAGAIAVAAAHERGPLARLGGPWRFVGAAAGLAALYAAALPEVIYGEARVPLAAVIGLAVVTALAAAVCVRGGASQRVEVATAVGVAGVALVLVLVAPDPDRAGGFGEELAGASLAFALIASGVFVAASIAVAVLGAVRSAPALTNLAMAALVLFVAVQSFAVFAPLASGATLFLVVGVLLIVTGVLAEQGRRRLLRGVTG